MLTTDTVAFLMEGHLHQDPTALVHEVDHAFEAFRLALQVRVEERLANKEPVFTTSAEGLFEEYLASFPPERVQHYNCRCCKNFIERYGSLVTIENGVTRPLIWDDSFGPAARLARIVKKATVTGVFVSEDRTLGSPKTGPWTHLALVLPLAHVHKGLVKTAHQVAAEKLEDRKNVAHAIGAFKIGHLEQAVGFLETDALYRAEKVIGPAKWLLEVMQEQKAASRHTAPNFLWKRVAQAPAGFCHPRSSMIGTLLEDLASGSDFASAASRFKEKMHPLSYQRPQAAPKEGTIAQAEIIVQRLGAVGALRRRFARLDEVPVVWAPPPAKVAPPAGGVFGHLRQQPHVEEPITGPVLGITWEKFARTVLPTADEITYTAPYGSSQPFVALVTAADASAPPILQWDSEERRNPVSWYLYNGGASATQFNLPTGKPIKVVGITLKPSMWNDPEKFAHQGNGVVFLLEGAKDTGKPGICLFPEILKAEFHGIRSVIERHSRTAKIEDEGGPYSTGLFQSGKSMGAEFTVKSGNKVARFKLDRWD